MWHLEVESLLVLKNNRGTDANRVRHMDYGVQINKLMYTRLLKGEAPCSARPTSRACTTPSSPIRTSSSVCTPNTKKTTASASSA
jgi:ribonucleotide reductase alpha subunit